MTVNRRVLLRGLGGAVVAAPFLSSLAEREAKAQGLPPPAAPKRLITMFTHYGCITTRWFPKKSHGPLTAADYVGLPTLAPMAPFASKLLMVRGIRAMNEWSFEGTLGQKNDPHTQVCGSFYTCHPIVPNSTESSVSNVGKFDGKPTGRSLDHISAEQVNAAGVDPLFLQIGGIRGSSSNTSPVISWNAPEQMFPGYGQPLMLWNKLTNLFGPGPVSGDTYRAVRGKSIIDIVRDDLSRLKSFSISQADKRKVDAWTALLHDTGNKIVPVQCTMGTASDPNKLNLTTARVTEEGGTGLNSDISKSGPVMMDLAVLSAICDTTRVIFMKFPPSYVMKFLGITLETTSLSHRTGSALMGGACITNAIDQIAKVDNWYAQQFAYLVGRLDSFQEGDRTLLDNSATVWLQEMSDGSAHNLNNLPILQAGSCGGYFKTGQAVNVEGGVADMTPGHSDDDCKNGTTVRPLDDAGTPPDIATQPINKYYCNLMNAIGVKAGADGFPMKGGTAPVTKFGKYDDTRLFGTTQPATIRDPGEYTQLRAT